ncbi:hypothetical protein DB32_000256 [Sandaracinus amylolyticus]|uniref:Uncharacterized protein n=1 Tax=Sandaracinus amylolyticus TaxID=927083 RepID=A0A0F6YFU2_9BACT|nr:hypothetical protein DB32_000256 [Sandaracinus amylolyticus]
MCGSGRRDARDEHASQAQGHPERSVAHRGPLPQCGRSYTSANAVHQRGSTAGDRFCRV